MDTQVWPYELASRKLRSKRQKQRLMKKDRDKRLIRLYKDQDALYRMRSALPLVPLEEPYRKGWKRFFVVRDDVRRSRYGPFFEALLPKINVELYQKDKDFTKRKNRRSKKRIPIEQHLRTFCEWEWNASSCKLTDVEKQLFSRVEYYDKWRRRIVVKYVFNEPWRYVLVVRPHIITHRKMKDEVLEQQIAELSNHIRSNDLGPKMYKLTKGRSYRYRHKDEDYIDPNPFKNIQLHKILGAIEEQKIKQ